MLKKLRIIILSRFKNKEEEEYIKKRRVTCLECESNSLNATSISMLNFFMTALSNFYSFITGNSKEDNLGNCLACEACSVYYKTAEDEESCPKGKWKVHLKIREERKNGNKKNNREV